MRTPDTARAQRAPRLRVGFLSAHDPFDRRAFSGTSFHAARALEGRDDLAVSFPGWRRPGPLGRWRARLSPRAAPTGGTLDLSGLDALVALVSSDLVDALPNEHPPLFHVTDATPAFLREFYGHEVPASVDAREARVIARAARVVYSSAFMARRAVAEFGLAPGKTTDLPFGVNLDDWPGTPAEKAAMAPLRLLFVGTDWHRKGGDIALAAFEALRAKGIAAQLDLVGAAPPEPLPEGAVAHGYLDKNTPRQAARLAALFGAAHLFVLPTRADCTPMVIAEAGVHATPVLVTATGGIGSLVEEGTNGRLLPEAATPEDWAAVIADVTAERAAYGALSRRAHGFATATLTWTAWAAGIAGLLHGLPKGRKSRSSRSDAPPATDTPEPGC